jgi:nicotianamine synthase
MNTLLATIDRIATLTSLEPSGEVNELFSSLVAQVRDAPELPRLPIDTLTAFRRTCAASESLLEFSWAKKILASEDPAKALRAFPYYDNYQKLVNLEWSTLKSSGLVSSPGSRILMIGAGPLPLTTLLFAKKHNMLADHIDIDSEALHYCQNIADALALETRHIHGSGQTVELSDKYDVILIAALAGETTEEKRTIIKHVLPHLKKDGRFIIRSANGARALLYPEIDPDDLSDLVTIHTVYHPIDEVINSVIIGGKK